MTMNEINNIIFQAEDNEVNNELAEQRKQVDDIIDDNPILAIGDNSVNVKLLTVQHLKNKLSEPVQLETSKIIGEITNSDMTPMEQITAIQEVLKEKKKRKVSLKKYYIEYLDGTLYIAPVTSKGGGNGGNTTSVFESNLSDGDNLQLEHEGKKSEKYYYIHGDLLDVDGNLIKASKAVELFMVKEMGKVLPPNFKGYPGLSHPYWRKLS